VVLLTSLLSHENTDIAIDVIEVIQELTDEDVGAIEDDLDDDDEAEGSGGGKAVQVRMAMAEFVDELVSHAIFEAGGS
jgi:beta-catenin-like protein 1